MDGKARPGHDELALWRTLEAASILQCPVCCGALKTADQQFTCLSCSSVFPVEAGVPLLMRPAEVTSVSDQVMTTFNLPHTFRKQVETALGTLTKYRTQSHPEFANFFARFDGSVTQAYPIPLDVADTAAAIAKVDCLTSVFPEQLPTPEGEFRSVRLRNGSDRVLFTGNRNRLYLSYRVATLDGRPVPCEASRSPLPCPLPPGSELTVPVMVKLPEGLTGQFLVRICFILVGDPVASDSIAPVDAGRPTARTRLSAWRNAFRPRPDGSKPSDQAVGAAESVHWFDASPLVEMTVTAIAGKAEFPALRRGSLTGFDVQEDVHLAEDFLSGVVAGLRAKGVANPRILEIGAGVHPVALRICDQATTVVVSDISLVMQTLAAIMHGNNPAVLEGRAAFASFDMMHPPFQDGAFDIICICAAFHHIPDPVNFLQRLAPMLSAQGRFVALREPCIVNPSEPTYITELSNGFNEQMFELSEWQAIIDHGGLVIEEAVIDFGCSLKFSARRPAPTASV